jgi:hypothetical protein
MTMDRVIGRRWASLTTHQVNQKKQLLALKPRIHKLSVAFCFFKLSGIITILVIGLFGYYSYFIF